MKRPTYEDVLNAPENKVAEILDGELVLSPRPAMRHSLAASTLGTVVGEPFGRGRGGPGGWWILDEPELHLGRDVLVPDLGGWRRSRLPRLPETAYFPLAPDWICEVLSPSTAQLDRAKKLAIYGRELVAHAWLIDPLARTLEVLRLEHGRWVILGAHAGSEVVRAEPFAELDLELEAWWAD